MADDWTAGGFGLYVHWPFCAAKCPYCDFNSHVTRSVDHDAWRTALVAEVERVGRATQGRVLQSVFFGGGTPSLMAPETVGAILDAVHRTWPVANALEVTLEANPTSVEADRFRAFRAAGVNRISMGIQALNDTDLRALGRLHSTAEALAAFDIARATFDRVSFDLIYARQNQSLIQWERELSQALSLDLDHLSLYQLTIEPGTAFGDRHARGLLSGLPADDMAADMYDLTQEICSAAGLERYEVSNHARDGAQAGHNLIYWRYGDYAGIGPGAHGRLTSEAGRYATEQTRAPGPWLAGQNREKQEQLSAQDQATEMLMMGLRLVEGVDLDRYAALAGHPLAPDRIAEVRDLGLLEAREGRIIATNQGLTLLNSVLATLLVD